MCDLYFKRLAHEKSTIRMRKISWSYIYGYDYVESGMNLNSKQPQRTGRHFQTPNHYHHVQVTIFKTPNPPRAVTIWLRGKWSGFKLQKPPPTVIIFNYVESGMDLNSTNHHQPLLFSITCSKYHRVSYMNIFSSFLFIS